MKWAALIAWVITAGGGFVLLAIWLARGGMQQQEGSRGRIRPPLIMSHFLLAAGGLVLWVIYVVTSRCRSSGSTACSPRRRSCSCC
jgi:hypothetical protein